MFVKLLNYTQEPEKTVALAGRLCYSPKNIEETQNGLDRDYIAKMVNMLRDSGHLSTFEHVSFTFGIEGVSRALTHQLVRHRLASYSQQSQRYVKEKQFEYIIPDSIKKAGIEDRFKERMATIQEWYNEAMELGIPAEDARFYLPNASETKIIVTMNARELLHFFEHRCCNRAQWEIRAMADEMIKLAKEKAPYIFENSGPPCVKKECPEGKMSCGKIKEMREKYRSVK